MNAQQRIQRQLEEVLRQPGNDCKATAPRWASVNLGVFLCVTCASVHRKMGTHKSRVKSVTLDEWTREQVATMREIGNTRSNAIYNPDERLHPAPASIGGEERDSEIAKYIRRKYELGAFKRGAARDLASTSVNSRAQAQAARSGGLAPPPARRQGSLSPSPSPGSRDRELPALPGDLPGRTSSRRPAPPSSTPVWNGVSGRATSPSTSVSPLPTASRAPAPSAVASQPAPRAPAPAPAASQNLLVDIEGSSSSTRPLQLSLAGNFPTVPAHLQAPHAPPFPPMQSPLGSVPSPLALGQQAFAFQWGQQVQAQSPPPMQQQQQGYFPSPMMQGGQMGMPMQMPQMGMQMGQMPMGGMGMQMNGAMGYVPQQQYQQQAAYGQWM